MTLPNVRAACLLLFACATLPAATLLTATPSTIAVTCNTLTGPGAPAQIVIKPAAPLTATTIPVTAAILQGTGLVVTPPAPAALSAANQAQGLTFTVNAAPGCAGMTGTSATLRFYAAGVSDVSVAATLTAVATGSPLGASPVTLSCFRAPGPPAVYTPGPAQTATVASAAAGGTPFAVDTSQLPAWISLGSNGGVATTAGVPLTLSAAAPCGNFAVGSANTVALHLRNAPAPDALLAVTLQVFGPSPLSAAPAAPVLSYVKGSAAPSALDLALTGPAASPFTVDPASLPAWLTFDLLSGTAPRTLHATTTSVAESMNPGSYSATVRVQVAGYADLAVPFTLSIANPAPKLTLAEGATRAISWTLGQALPVVYITVASSGAAIPYTTSTAGALSPVVSAGFAKGLAYSYGTPIPVTFDPNVMAAAQAGTTLAGTVTITWGSPAVATVVNLQLAVQSSGASLTALSPVSVPTAAPGEVFTIALAGTGFVVSADPAQRTFAGLVSGGQLVADANVTATVVNASNIIVVIQVPAAADPLLPFAPTGPGGTITLGVCNPGGTACTTPTGVATLGIGAIPVVQAVTSASAYLQVTAPALATVAPYDIVSVFGFNFCDPGGTGCGTRILYGALDPATLRYPTSLTPDSASANRRLLTVTFQTHAATPVVIATATLLFATDAQINLLAPSALSAYIGKSVDMVVGFGATASAPFAVNVAASNPGLFTVGADGQGEGAILSLDWSFIASGNEAGLRQNAADSDIVQIYGTGWGAPDSTADNAAAGAGAWPADCISIASLVATLNASTSAGATTADGALLAGGVFNTGRLAPCLGASADIPSVTIGGQPATVTYAGWVAGSVAGQYQVNVRLPGSAGPFTAANGAVIAGPLTAPVQLPVVLTARGRASQPGVVLWVAPRLKVAAPAAAALSGKAGTAWPSTGSAVSAGQGTAPYSYTLSAGTLPAGLSLNAATGTISGTPALDAAGAYTVTVTATDSAALPLTGSITFALIVAR